MSVTTYAVLLTALSAVWLGFVIPGTSGARGVNWETLLLVGVLPVGALWVVFLIHVLRKRRG